MPGPVEPLTTARHLMVAIDDCVLYLASWNIIHYTLHNRHVIVLCCPHFFLTCRIPQGHFRPKTAASKMAGYWGTDRLQTNSEQTMMAREVSIAWFISGAEYKLDAYMARCMQVNTNYSPIVGELHQEWHMYGISSA